MASKHVRTPRESDLTLEQRARVAAIRAKNRDPERRAEEGAPAMRLTVNFMKGEL